MIPAIIFSLLSVAIVAFLVYFLLRRIKFSNRSGKRGGHARSASSMDMPMASPAGGTEHISTNIRSAARTDSVLRNRFIAAGAATAAIIGTLGTKVWWMQVINQSRYESEAEANKYSTVLSPAPRGCIYDVNGVELVKNRSSLTVVGDADVAKNSVVVGRLSALLGLPRGIIRNRLQDSTVSAQSQRIIKSDVSIRDIAFIVEHIDAFSGVNVETRMVREYPYRGLAAHVLGYTGTASIDDLEYASDNRVMEMGDDVGKAGVEAYYDDLLAGEHGVRRLITDATGNTVSLVSDTQPKKGSDIYLTLDAEIQYCTDMVLRNSIGPEDGAIGSGVGTAGAVVIMDVRTGGIVAMSSFPTFEPGEFVGGIGNNTWDIYTSDDANNPLMNRTIGGLYPAASTFKSFVSLAGMKYGYIDTSSRWTCTGSWDGWNSGLTQNCWNLAGHGEQDFYLGVVNSCDVVFYDVAKHFFDDGDKLGQTVLQDEIKQFGFGKLTGIDLGGEAYGRVPTPSWKKEYFKDQPEMQDWYGGDLTNMCIGQGYILITPLQLAVAYCGIATGQLMKPHVLDRVVNSRGENVVTAKPEVIGIPEVKQEYYDNLRPALWGVVNENFGVLNYFTEHGYTNVGAKTGTAEVAGKDDYGLCAVYAPFDDPHYVISVLIEEGGGGSTAAMPVAAEIVAALMKKEAGIYKGGVGPVPGSLGKKVEKQIDTPTGRTD